MKKLILSFLLFPVIVAAQTRQVTFTVDPYNLTVQALIYLPANYSNVPSLPVLVFLHGKGEAGTDINKMYVNGPFHFIQSGWQPDFIVVAPQATSWSLNSQGIDSVFSQVIRNYKGDAKQLYLTGISAGGESTWNYISHHDITPSFRINAAVIMSGATEPTSQDASYVAKDKIQLWGFGSLTDIWGEQTDSMVNKVNLVAPGTARFTSYNGGHCCWNQFYDPSYEEDFNGKKMNIYDWMMQYSQGNDPKTVLSVAFLNFTARSNASGILLNWSTSSEENSDHFEIQESDDGNNFTTIAQVPTQAINGNSGKILTYNYEVSNVQK